MKKQIILPTLLALLTVPFISSCGDNEDFTANHILTQDELAEMHRQDSIAEAQRSSINADLILEYDINFFISASSYDGTSVDIDMAQIAQFMGVDLDQLCTNLDEGAGDVVPFAIEGSTHADNMGSSTAGAYWGNWWDGEGNVCSWGDAGSNFFTEFNGEKRQMNIGQYPGKLTAGQTVTLIMGLKYQDKRVAVVFHITAEERGEVVAGIVGASTIQLAMTPQTDYSSNPVALPVSEICGNLGIGSMAEAQFLAVNTDGSYCQETDDGWGFWFDKQGFKGSWGDNASVMVGWDAGAEQLGVLQMPGGLAAGESVTAACAFIAGEKIQLVNIVVTIESYQDPETAPEGAPENKTIDVTLEKNYTGDYASVQVDVRETLREAFKMTTYQIFSAKQSGDLKIYAGAPTEEDPAYTADAPGYWLKADGTAAGWGESVFWCSLGGSETELFLYGGNHPDNVSRAEGVELTSLYSIVCNGATVTVNLHIKCGPEAVQ